MSNFPDGFSYTGSFRGIRFVRGFIDMNLSGITGGACIYGGNVSQEIQDGGTHVYSNQTGSARYVDLGDVVINPLGAYTYRNILGDRWVDVATDWVSWTPTVTSGSGTITSYTVNSAKYLRRAHDVLIRLHITITDNGTGATHLDFTLPFTATANGGSVSGRETVTSGLLVGGACVSTFARIVAEGNTYPVATNSQVILTGIYEAA
jgi:hypothetical protein